MPAHTRLAATARESVRLPQKLDLRTALTSLYRASARKASVVDVPPLRDLTIDGRGDPRTAPAYREAVEALFALSYALKFLVKRGPMALDFAIMPLEGLWWVDGAADVAEVWQRRETWRWTAMILQPDAVTEALFEEARGQTARKKTLPALAKLRLETIHEGRAVQVLHVGPYADEHRTIERLHHEVAVRGAIMRGKHHEIYPSGPARTAPETCRTILRQPFACAARRTWRPMALPDRCRGRRASATSTQSIPTTWAAADGARILQAATRVRASYPDGSRMVTCPHHRRDGPRITKLEMQRSTT